MSAKTLNGSERLAVMYRALNPYRRNRFMFDWDYARKIGANTKDFISPSSIVFGKKDFELGDCYGSVMSVNLIASELKDRLEYYDFLMESYGGHQEFVSPLGATFPEEYFIRKNGQSFKAWNTQPLMSTHKGVDIVCPENTKIYAVADGEIQNVKTSSFEISVPDLDYFDIPDPSLFSLFC